MHSSHSSPLSLIHSHCFAPSIFAVFRDHYLSWGVAVLWVHQLQLGICLLVYLANYSSCEISTTRLIMMHTRTYVKTGATAPGYVKLTDVPIAFPQTGILKWGIGLDGLAPGEGERGQRLIYAYHTMRL